MVHITADLIEDTALYYLRGLQLIFGLAIIGVAGGEISSWHSSVCNPPARLSFNVAVAALVLPALIYLLLSTGWGAKKIRVIPWSIWVQLAIDGLFLIFWLAVGALWAEDISCNELCSICSAYADTLPSVDHGIYSVLDQCLCQWGQVYDPYSSRKLAIRASSGAGAASAIKLLNKLSKKSEKLGLDWVMFILFLISFGVTVYYIYEHRKAVRNASPPAGEPQVISESQRYANPATSLGKEDVQAESYPVAG